MPDAKDVALSFQEKADADLFWKITERKKDLRNLSSSDIMPDQENQVEAAILTQAPCKENLSLILQQVEPQIICNKDFVIQKFLEHDV